MSTARNFISASDAKCFHDWLSPEESKKTKSAFERMRGLVGDSRWYWESNEFLCVVHLLGHRTIAGLGKWIHPNGCEAAPPLLRVRQIGVDYKPTGEFSNFGYASVYELRPAGITEVVRLCNPGWFNCDEPRVPKDTERCDAGQLMRSCVLPYRLQYTSWQFCHEVEIPF